MKSQTRAALRKLFQRTRTKRAPKPGDPVVQDSESDETEGPHEEEAHVADSTPEEPSGFEEEVSELGDPDPRSRLLTDRSISARLVSMHADCPKQLGYFMRGSTGADVGLFRDAVNARVHHALTDILGLPPEERTHEAVEPALKIAWFRTDGQRFYGLDEHDAAETESRKILHDFINRHDLSGRTTAQGLNVVTRIPVLFDEVNVEVEIERVSVEQDGSLTLTAYEFGEPGRHKFEMHVDPMIRLWLIAASTALREPIARIKNVYVRHDVEEVFEVRPGDLEASLDLVSLLINWMRFETTFKADPGIWCETCDYRYICGDHELKNSTESRIAAHGGIV